jgi:hypothetical protein
MNRWPFVAAGVVLTAIFSWQSCQVLVREPAHPPAQATEEDYPLAVGLVWVYKSAEGFQVVREFVGDVEDSGHRWFDMSYSLPIGKEQLFMRRTPEGIVARRGSREQLIMKFPMNPGDAWTIDFPDRPLAECTVDEPEEIDVLGKKVRASKLRIIKTERKSGAKTTHFEWYARGVGLAQMQVKYGLTYLLRLERFEKAK